MEKLRLSLDEDKNNESMLRIMECINLKKLILNRWNGADVDLATEIVKFKRLTTLKILNCSVSIDEMRELVEHLPNLTTFEAITVDSESAEDKIFSVLLMFPCLKKLKVLLQDHERFYDGFKSQAISRPFFSTISRRSSENWIYR